MLKGHIKKGLRILLNPEKAFSELKNATLEDVIGYYMQLLVLTSAAAGISNLLFSIGKALYFDVFFRVDVVYWTMLNYILGRSMLLALLYIFFGTFILFFISIALKLLFSKIKYTDLMKILLLSLTPFLLFAWLPFAPFPLIIWSGFLFLTGVRSYKAVEIKRGSIKQRY